MAEHLLDVRHLQTVFHMGEGLVKAVDDATFHVDSGEIIGIVGESGSGKSVTMMSILKLIAMPPGEIVGGEAWFGGKDILRYPAGSAELRDIRGGGISMIFQEPMTSLNPVLTVGQQIMAKVYSICEDVNGNVWLGLLQKGIYMQPGKTMGFSYMGYKLGTRNIIGTACITSVFGSKNNYHWIGTDKDGLYCQNENYQPVKHFKENFPATILSICEDASHRIWVGLEHQRATVLMAVFLLV